MKKSKSWDKQIQRAERQLAKASAMLTVPKKYNQPIRNQEAYLRKGFNKH